MRRPALALSVSAALVAATGVALAADPLVPVPPVVPSTPLTAPVASANVTHVGTIPLEGVGVSMEVRTVGDQVRAFVSGAGGLSVYDATDPTRPLLLGHLPIYNWENEDIAVSKDATTAVLTEFEGAVYLHVVDVSNPALPTITGSIVPGGSHTVTCADDACRYLYGSEGQTYDITDRAHPKELATGWAKTLGVQASSGHNVHQDDAGYFIADANGKDGDLVMFRQVDGDPLRLQRVTTGTISKDTAYQHNNIRPRADRYKPRSADQSSDGPLKDGELLLGNGETNFSPQCDGGSGSFSTWSMKGFDKGRPMQQLDVLRPVNGDYATSGDPALNAMGCSGHWFTQKDAQDGSILVAGAWYEHGTRFLKVDPATGRIAQVGWFQPVRGATSEAFLMPTTKDGRTVVWSVDYHSGVDILLFDEQAGTPSVAQTDASWLAKKDAQDVFAIAERQLCKAGVSATPEQHAQMHAVTSQVAQGTPAAQLLAAG